MRRLWLSHKRVYRDLRFRPRCFTVGSMFAIRKQFLFTTLFMLSLGCFGQTPTHTLSFSSDTDNVPNFVQLPQDVLRLLLNDREDFPSGQPLVERCENREQAGSHPIRPEILCTKVHISSQSGDNYLIIGVGGLRGAHIVPFWLFHHDAKGASLLLKTRSDQIDIIPTQFQGYAEIRSTWIMGAGATTVTDSFRFNGLKYVRFHRQMQHQ